MAARDSYEPGTPSWVDLGVPDVDAAAVFYASLLGWKVQEPAPDSGGYRICTLRDRPVAGLGSQTEAQDDTWWTTYVSVVDCDATVAKVKDAGGTVAGEPTDVPGAGRMAVCADPQGAPFSLWQPVGFAGAGYVNEPGAWCWSELGARAPDKALAFYVEVFGWRAEPFRDSDTDRVFFVGDMPVASVTAVTEAREAWAVYFQVDECDAAVERVVELGGKSLGDPTVTPDIGRMAEVADPQGAVFWLLSGPG
jgi:predicted enzyme related to lactoylglutathione lyase